MDDVAYFTYAAQIMKNPFDPYGFEIAEGVPANHELLPPLLPYCLAPALSLFEDNPFLWKLCLLPFGLVLVFSLHVLFQRFAPSLEIPLTWFTVLSPAFLPSWNLMADVPVMALGFLSLHFFLAACDRSSVVLAILAGMGAGLAMQTKYVAFMIPTLMLIYAILFRKLPLGMLASIISMVFFVAWEFLFSA